MKFGSSDSVGYLFLIVPPEKGAVGGWSDKSYHCSDFVQGW